MPPLGVVTTGVFVAAAAAAGYWVGTRHARRRTAALAGAAQEFCLRNCRLPDARCPLLRFDMRREDCPLWRFVTANLQTDRPVNPEAPLGAGPYRNPVDPESDSR
ncbi:MAG: hypothetical protein JSW43_01910 [Gemmatimonadota bacterium]|nr:MAG: hypothetical protein JSW43_01910 [Gemmatimonadota bacterium]